MNNENKSRVWTLLQGLFGNKKKERNPMDQFYVIDGSDEEFDTLDEATLAAKRKAAFNLRSLKQRIVYDNGRYVYEDVGPEDVYIYQAVSVAREPTPDVLVETLGTSSSSGAVVNTTTVAATA